MTQSPDTQNLSASLAFLLHPGLSPAEKRQLADHIDRPVCALSHTPPEGCGIALPRWAEWRKPLKRIQAATELATEWLSEAIQGAAPRSAISYWDAAYPAPLRHLHRPPWLLFVEGTLPSPDAPAVSVVGSRNPTRAGLRRAHEFSAALASRGWTIVSGLARGIDGAAHRGALDAQGCTVAVLGCGIDQQYPPEHAHLRQAIIEQGGALVSEYPPRTPPNERFFPARNRIIAAWSKGVLVVEAAIRSGSLITAQQANELGRAVMAIPGSIDTPQARGCHQMIRSGARLIETVDDLLEEMLPAPPAPKAQKAQAARVRPQTSDPGLQAVLDLFEGQPRQLDELASQAGLATPALTSQLLQLELDGLLEQRPGQWWTPA